MSSNKTENNSIEIWKQIELGGTIYEVSNLGKFRKACQIGDNSVSPRIKYKFLVANNFISNNTN